MADKKPKRRWIVRGLVALLIILLILALLPPILINLKPVKERILAGVSKEIGGQVKCERIVLSFFPLPHVGIHKGSLSIPGKVSGHSDSIGIYPEILPLFTGKLRLRRIHVKDPVFTYEIQKKGPVETKEKPKPLSPADILEDLDPVMAFLASKSPNLLVQIENGRMRLAMEHELVFQYQDLRAQNDIPDNKMAIDIDDFTITIDGLGDLQGKKRGSVPQKTSDEANKKLVLRGRNLKTSLTASKEEATLSLIELNLDHPRLNLSGKSTLTQASPPIRLELVGKELDIFSTREVALALAGDDPTVRDIFDYMRGGKIPLITFSSQGHLLDELDDSENMLIEADLVEGKVHVPGPDLDLEGVKGQEIRISKGILYGEKLDARLGNTLARNGSLRVGLEGDDAPFHLDILVDADLAQLPPILKRLVAGRDFKQEMELIDKLEGKASGRMVLGETTASIDVRVDVSKFNFSAQYRRVPYPLEVDGGRFFLEGSRIDVEKVNIKAGQSFFSDLTGKFEWEKIPYIEIKSPRSELFLAEVFPFVKSIRGISEELTDIKSLEGVVILSAMSLKGPLLTAAKWIYESTGEVRKLALNTTLLPGPVKMRRAGFKTIETGTEQKLSFSDAHIAMLDGSLKVSGVLYDYIRGLNKVDLTLQGNMGKKTTRWISKLIHLPPEMSLRPPLSFSKARLVWVERSYTSFAGDLVVHNGPKVVIDVLRKPGELTIKKLLVQHRNSRASIQFSLKENDLSLLFKGKLTERTMRELHEGYYDLPGMLEGDFSARISLDQPVLSTAQGRIMGNNLMVPYDLKIPLIIKGFALDARDNHLRLKSTRVLLGENHLVLAGDMYFSARGLLFNMDLTTDSLDWNSIEKIVGPESEEKQKKNEKGPQLLIYGTLKLTSNSFKYDRFVWRPVHANILFGRDNIDIIVTEANLCNISTPGVLEITPEDIALDFSLISKDQELDPAIDCLLREKGVLTGNFDLQGKVTARGKSENLSESARVNIKFQARDGRIYHTQQVGVLKNTFVRLSVVDMFKGRLPDLKTEGFPYRSAIIKAKIENGKLVLEKGFINGEGMQIFGHGEVDLVDKQLDLEIAVAPLKTVDTVVKYTPIIGRIFGGRLVSVPVKVTGDWADPEVKIMPASSVGKGLLGIMERTVKLPVDLVQPSASDKQ